MMHDKNTFTLKTWANPKILAMVISAVLLPACGSGDGGGDNGTNDPPPVNDIPVVTSTACLSTDDLPIDLNKYVDDDDALLGFQIKTQGNKGMAIIDPDGTLSSYTLNTPGTTGFDSFTYEVDDNDDGVAIGTVNIAVSKTRIMPLGDSITAGVEPKGPTCTTPMPPPTDFIPDDKQIGYRAKLFSDLKQGNYFVDFVGREQSGKAATPPIEDQDHEGIGGETASMVNDRINAALIANPAEIVLLHVGTNNINNDIAALTIIDIENILVAINGWAVGNTTTVTVLLSTIIERSNNAICATPDYGNTNVTDLNVLISNLTPSLTNITLVPVDQHGAINNPVTQISIDGVHPNQTGYRLMADEWFKELTDPSNNIPILKCP